MSGYTRPKSPLQIAQEQIAKLTGETNRMRQINQDMQRNISHQAANSQNRIRQIQDRMENRNRSFGGMISKLKSGLKGSEHRFNDAITKQGKAFYKSQHETRAEFGRKLAKQSKWTSEQISNERQERIKVINQERIERKRALEKLRQDTERKIAKERARTDKLIANERNARIKALERERELTNQQIQQLDNEINARIDAERLLTDAKIDNLEAFTEARLTEQKAEYHKLAEEKQIQIDAIREDVESIFQQTDNQRELATHYLEDLQKIVVEVDKSLPHQKFAPGELRDINNRINQASIHVNGAPQAAIANAQETYFDLVKLREKVLEKEAEFNMWHINVQETLAALQGIINDNRKLEIEGVSQEADYWTFGKYSEFEKKVKMILDSVDVGDDLSLEDLKEIHESINDLKKEHEELIREALNQIMSSQVRFEIADSTAEALAKEDYEVVEGGYEGGDDGEADPRKAFLMKLSNGIHEIVVIVNPESSTANSLILNSQDSTYKNPEVALARMQEIAKVIQEDKGIAVSTPECMDVEHRIQDIYGSAFDEVYKKGIPKRIREQLGINDPIEKKKVNVS